MYIQHGIELTKRLGAKVTVLTVMLPFHTFTINTQIIEDTPAQRQLSTHFRHWLAVGYCWTEALLD
jgi:hypothetical protein